MLMQEVEVPLLKPCGKRSARRPCDAHRPDDDSEVHKLDEHEKATNAICDLDRHQHRAGGDLCIGMKAREPAVQDGYRSVQMLTYRMEKFI